jgi:hypothetical protein
VLDGNLRLLVIGAAFGLVVSVVGALVEYRLHLRKPAAPAPLPGGFLSLVAGFLAFLGLVAVVVSLVATGGIKPAAVMGLGVGIGFYTGFAVLTGLFFLLERPPE